MRKPVWFAILLLSAVPIVAQSAPANSSPAYATTFAPDTSANPAELARHRLNRALVDLRDDGLRLRQSDGGALSAAHRAALQRRLDAATARYAAYVAPGCLGTRIACNDGS